jgi:hypothetical protein
MSELPKGSRKRSPAPIEPKGCLDREWRVHVSVPGFVYGSTDRNIPVRILDLSATGFRLVSEEPLRAMQLITIRCGADAHRGQIRWVSGNEAGGIFIDLR